MNTFELVEHLTQQGVQLQADNDKLNLISPKGVITPEIYAQLTAHKAEILNFLNNRVLTTTTPAPLYQGLSLQTIGRLIGGFTGQVLADYKPPTIDPKVMAQKLTVTFKPLPNNYQNIEILRFREELQAKLSSYGVTVLPWEQATTEFRYEIVLPVINWKQSFKYRVVRSGINAVIDVEKYPSFLSKIGVFAAENLYKLYTGLVLKNQEIPVTKIAKLSSWAEEHAAKYIEDPTNTQVIMLAQLDQNFIDPLISYEQKIKIGLNTLVRTFSEIVIGVSQETISILNMNLSDSIFSRNQVEHFILHSLIPKIYVPISPLLLNRFQIETFNPHLSSYSRKLVQLSKELATTGLFPPGFKLAEVLKRKSHRDIVNVIVNGRTGVSYGFVAYAEAPEYFGPSEICEDEWQRLLPVEGFSSDELRQNENSRRYIKLKLGEKYLFKQIPNIWLVSSRSGSNKTNLNLESDIIRIGLKEKLFLQLPQGVDHKVVDIKPSYDIYVMLAISLAAALYTPELIQDGAPIVHFHGYPASEWFQAHEHYVGVNNPSVPCGTYESGIFNFLGIASLANEDIDKTVLVSLIEPDHGTNIIANDLDYIVARLKTGCSLGLIELGGKHFNSLKSQLAK